jgi:hypothetical protein
MNFIKFSSMASWENNWYILCMFWWTFSYIAFRIISVFRVLLCRELSGILQQSVFRLTLCFFQFKFQLFIKGDIFVGQVFTFCHLNFLLRATPGAGCSNLLAQPWVDIKYPATYSTGNLAWCKKPYIRH